MIDARLLAVASLVRKGTYFCDVGTDHGYLPCHLVQNGIVSQCVASDINELPLASAKHNIEQLGLSDKIELVLSDGLATIPTDVLDIAIAGMGGELIASIISRAEFLKDDSRRLILQPMTNAVHLRRCLFENGFEILSEIPVIDKKHYYNIIHAQYCGEIKLLSTVDAFLGKIPMYQGVEALLFVHRQLERVLAIVAGLRKTADCENDVDKYLKLALSIENIYEEMQNAKES